MYGIYFSYSSNLGPCAAKILKKLNSLRGNYRLQNSASSHTANTGTVYLREKGPRAYI